MYWMLIGHHCSKPNYISISLRSSTVCPKLGFCSSGQVEVQEHTLYHSSLCSVLEHSSILFFIPDREMHFVDFFFFYFILRATKELAQKTKVYKVLWRLSPSLLHFINLSSETTFACLGLIKSFCMQNWKEPISPLGLFLHLIWVECTHFLRINYNCF